MTKLKMPDLRAKTRKDLQKEATDLKSELAKIGMVRKQIARVLTVYSQKQREEARKEYKDKKYQPLDLRKKKTRAIRLRLTHAQKTKPTQKAKVKKQNFPMRRFAVAA